MCIRDSAPLAKDGLVDVDEKGIQVTAKGRLLIRNICMCFDTYLRTVSYTHLDVYKRQSSAQHARPRKGTQASCCLRKYLFIGLCLRNSTHKMFRRYRCFGG